MGRRRVSNRDNAESVGVEIMGDAATSIVGLEEAVNGEMASSFAGLGMQELVY